MPSRAMRAKEKPRRCAARVGERFLAVRLPGPQIQDKAADVTEPTFLRAQGVGPVLAPSLQICRHGSEARGG